MRWAALATALFAVGLVAHFTAAPAAVDWAFFLASYAAGGWEPGLAGLAALRAKTLDVDLLMVVAAIGAAAIGQVLDGGLLIVIFATSGALEAVATHRTAQAVRGLLDLAPEQAARITGDGAEETVDAERLRIGDVILVRPGERIAADGRVLSGASDVDQATITGEPLPVAKAAGDEVFAGTANGTGALRVRVSRGPRDSVVARIVAMVEEAAATKASTQLFIEKVEQRYSIGMVTATLLLFAVPLLAGAAFQPTPAARDDLHDRRLAVRGGAGHHAAAAGLDGQRRTARRAGQIGGGDGAARRHHPRRLRQDRHPDRGHPPPGRDQAAARPRPERAGDPRAGRGGRGPVRAPARPGRGRRRP